MAGRAPGPGILPRRSWENKYTDTEDEQYEPLLPEGWRRFHDDETGLPYYFRESGWGNGLGDSPVVRDVLQSAAAAVETLCGVRQLRVASTTIVPGPGTCIGERNYCSS